MPLSFEPFDPKEAASPVEWLCSETWPFHVSARQEPDDTTLQETGGG